MGEKWDDQKLGRLMRRGLRARADAMPDSGARGRSPRRWPLVAAAAAAVVGLGVVVPVALSQLGADDHGPSEEPSAAASPSAVQSTDPSTVPGDWRVESWREVSVRVPPTWGWGGGPVSGEWTEGNLVDCGAAPFVVPGSDEYENVPGDSAYVGRPVMMTDACFGSVGDLPERVRGDFVLLGSPYRFGVHELTGGFTAQTVEAGALSVTVVTRDAALRKKILSTVAVAPRDPNGCASVGPGRAEAPDGMGIDSPGQLTVCVYDDAGELVWSQVKGAPQARGYVDAYRQAGAFGLAGCEGGQENVLLRIDGRTADGEPVQWRQTVDTACGRVDSGKGMVRLTRGAARFWTGGGTAAYVVGPDGGWDWPGMFRGALG